PGEAEPKGEPEDAGVSPDLEVDALAGPALDARPLRRLSGVAETAALRMVDEARGPAAKVAEVRLGRRIAEADLQGVSRREVALFSRDRRLRRQVLGEEG